MLSSSGILSAVEIAFFSPTLLLSAYICFRHGFNREQGWFYLVLLAVLRLVGASCLLYAEVNHDRNRSLYIASFVCNSVGTAPLLLAMMGFLKRVNDGMEHKGVSARVFRPVQLLSLAALVVAIVGGSYAGSNDASQFKTGRELAKAAAVIFLAIWVALSGLAILSYTRIRWILANERKLILACLISIPFLMVRIVYAVAVGFTSSPTAPFYFLNISVYVQAFMQFSMEAVVVLLYVAAGLATPKMPKRELVEGAKEGEPEQAPISQEIEMETGRVGPRQEPVRQEQRAERSWGDYRPSRMVMNAVRDSRR